MFTVDKKDLKSNITFFAAYNRKQRKIYITEQLNTVADGLNYFTNLNAALNHAYNQYLKANPSFISLGEIIKLIFTGKEFTFPFYIPPSYEIKLLPDILMIDGKDLTKMTLYRINTGNNSVEEYAISNMHIWRDGDKFKASFSDIFYGRAIKGVETEQEINEQGFYLTRGEAEAKLREHWLSEEAKIKAYLTT